MLAGLNALVPVLMLLITALGWIVTYKLLLHAQNKNLLNQILNAARLEVTAALRKQQQRLGQLYAGIGALRFALTLEEEGLSGHWSRKVHALREAFSGPEGSTEWLARLEEYEILFPETAECRRELAARDGEIGQLVTSVFTTLLSPRFESGPLEERGQVVEKAWKESFPLIDQGALIQDLLIHLQNRCLSALTGNAVPERRPRDPDAPRIVKDANGVLHVSVPGTTGGEAGTSRPAPQPPA